MKFKPTKSRSLSLRKGELVDVRFAVGGQGIPTVADEPVKSLGRWYDRTLKDTKQGVEVMNTAKQGLEKINKTKIQGKFKVWIIQFMLIPKLLWPLTLYEIGVYTVERIEKMINRFTRKWLGLPPGLTTVALYSRSSKLKLPLKSVTEEFKAGKVRLQAMLRFSGDPNIERARIQVKSGRKWKAAWAFADAEERVRFKEVTGATQVGRHGLGFDPARVWWSSASDKQRRDLIVQEVHSQEEAARFQMAVQQGQQGQWTSWDDTLQRALSWDDMWQMSSFRLGFVIRAVYDQLPSSDNLAKWNKCADKKCGLCGGTQTLKHVLSACKQSLATGRYTWRHNQVLRVLIRLVDNIRTEGNTRRINSSVAPGNTSTETSTALATGLFDAAIDWELAADLDQWRKYPAIITTRGARPDIVLISETCRTVIAIELTVPFESNMSESHEFKLAKYEPLRDALHATGYTTHMFAVEVGARGFAGSSVYSLMKRLAVPARVRNKCLKEIAEAAERASYWIWLKRDVIEWKPSDEVSLTG